MKNIFLICSLAIGTFILLGNCKKSDSIGKEPPDVVVKSDSIIYVSTNGSDSNAGTLAAPFLTLEKARNTMRASASPTKTIYILAGTYKRTATLQLTTADNNEIWRYYEPDGVNKAILDGGSTAPNTGVDIFTIYGGSNITINGLTFQNFLSWGIGIHGGVSDPPGGFPVSTTTAYDNTIINNIIKNGWTTYNAGWSGGGIWAQGQVINLTIKNNVIQNQYGSGIRLGSNGDGIGPNDAIGGYDIENNVILNTNINTGDNGAIYVQDVNFASADPVGTRRSLIKNNFIRDYQGKNGIGNGAPENMAIYFDCGASNADVTGNIIAPTANAITVTSGSQAIWIGGGHNDKVFGNIIDLGSTARIMNMSYAYNIGPNQTTITDMSNNFLTGNIYIGNWEGIQRSGVFGQTNVAFGLGEPIVGIAARPTVSNNVYYNYGSGTMSTSGIFSDASPVLVDPQISGWTYTIAPGSPVVKPPVNFPAIVGNWGPPGYLIPHTGTQPSCPH